MWTTNYRNSSHLWIHEFDNGYKVLSDLDLKENRIFNKDQKLIKTITFDENYSIDDHNRFLQSIDDLKPEKGNVEEREYGDNMVEE